MAAAKPKPLPKEVTVAMDALNKKHGDGTVMHLGTHMPPPVDVVPTGSLALDLATGCGGFPRGRIVEIFGPESCLDGDAFVQFEVRLSDGRRINHKGGSIRRLWERFHGEPPAGDGRGKYLRPAAAGAMYYAPSVNEEDRVFQNRIRDVVRVGVRECFRLSTLGGLEVVATADHRFFDGSRYVRLGDLAPGDTVMVHANTPFTREAPERGPTRRAYLYVKHHPVAGEKVVRARVSRTTAETADYAYRRLARSRAVVEAQLNQLDLDAYVARLNAGELSGLRFLSREDHVHHLDENETNDTIGNLVVISAAEHGRLHALDRHNNLRFVATEDVVAAVEPVGVREVFDLKMDAPFNNFVADGFVTHNSGKTTLSLHAIASAQAAGGQCAVVDAEHALDVAYARNLGVDVDRLVLSQPSWGEQALEVVEDLIDSGKMHVVLVDSVAALSPKAEIDGDFGRPGMGEHARLMSQAMRKLTAKVSQHKTLLIFINQIRHKIGVMFGSPETTTGGNALKFYASMRLDVRKRDAVKEPRAGAEPEQVGNITEVKVVKNKLAPPFKVARFEIHYGKGIDKLGDLLTVALEAGVVTKAGAWFSYGEERLGQGYYKAVDHLEESPILVDKIRDESMAVLRARTLPSVDA